MNGAEADLVGSRAGGRILRQAPPLKRGVGTSRAAAYCRIFIVFCEPFVVTSRLSLSRSKSDQSAYLMLSEAAQYARKYRK